LAGFERLKNELSALNVSVVCASVDSLENAKIVAGEVSFPVGYGVTRETGNLLGSWWEERRAFVQPSEFVLNRDGKVLASSYSAGPLGRMDAGDVVRWVTRLESMK
jgi:peroxiredoxin